MTRSCALFFALSSLSLVACGGGGGDPDAPISHPADARVDSPPAAGCGLDPAGYADLNLNIPALNAAQTTQAPINYYFAVLGDFGTTPTTGLFMLFEDNAGMFAPAGAAGSMTGPPSAPVTAPMDPDDMCGACLDGVVGFTPPTDISTATQIYTIDTGNFALATWTGTAGPGATVHMVGSYQNLTLSGYDATSGDPLGCTTTVNNLNLDWTVNFPATFAPANGPKGPRGIDLSNVQRATITH